MCCCFSLCWKIFYHPPLYFTLSITCEPLTLRPRPLTSQATILLPIYFQVAHAHSFYGKWLRWPLWPHRAHIIVLSLKTLLTTITLKGRWSCLLRAGSMPAKSTKDCVRAVTQQPITFSPPRLFTCGSQQQGAQMILDENTVVVAITETKLYWRNPFCAAGK